MRLKNEDYLSHIEHMKADEILDDVPKVLDFLISKQQPLALGSASKNAHTILEKVHLLEKFEAIVDGNGVTIGKPNPEVFLNAAKLLKVNPSDCIVFEDAIAGIQAANAAEMISIGIGDASVLNEADYVFKDFTEISETFLNTLISK
jgi:beta-phosphoglucomutase